LTPERIEPKTLRGANSKVQSQHRQANPTGVVDMERRKGRRKYINTQKQVSVKQTKKTIFIVSRQYHQILQKPRQHFQPLFLDDFIL